MRRISIIIRLQQSVAAQTFRIFCVLIKSNIKSIWISKKRPRMGNKKLSADENNFDFHKEKCLVLIKLDKLAVKLSGLGFLNFSFNFASFCSTFLHQTGIFCPILNSFVLLRLFLLHPPLHFQPAGHFLILVLAESIFGNTMCILWSQSLCLDLITHSGFLKPFENMKIFLQNSILQLHYCNPAATVH